MEIKINTYKKDGVKYVVDKTFIADTTNIFTSTIEDLLETLDLDSLKTLDLTRIEDSAGPLAVMITKASRQIKPLVMDCFEMTEEDYKKTKFKEIIKAVIQIVKASFVDIMAVSEVSEKN